MSKFEDWLEERAGGLVGFICGVFVGLIIALHWWGSAKQTDVWSIATALGTVGAVFLSSFFSLWALNASGREKKALARLAFRRVEAELRALDLTISGAVWRTIYCIGWAHTEEHGPGRRAYLETFREEVKFRVDDAKAALLIHDPSVPLDALFEIETQAQQLHIVSNGVSRLEDDDFEELKEQWFLFLEQCLLLGRKLDATLRRAPSKKFQNSTHARRLQAMNLRELRSE